MARGSEALPGRVPAGFVLWAGLVLGCGGDGPEEAAKESAREAGKREAVRRGRQLYDRHGCGLCHGPQGRGDGRLAASLNPAPRDLHDPRQYRQGSGLEQIEESIRRGVPAGGRNMPGYSHLSKEDLRSLAVYIQSLLEARD